MGVFICLMGTAASIANINDDIRDYQAMGVEAASSVSLATIAKFKSNSLANQVEHQSMINAAMQHARASLPDKRVPQQADAAVLFVSFSMPESLLFALADEAATYNIPVVINGLVDGDFKKTVQTFSRLNKHAKKQGLIFQGVSIDPVWFQQFNITAVPALVVSADTGECASQTVCAPSSFDVVYGNARLKKGLELIAAKGEAAPTVAKKILEVRHV